MKIHEAVEKALKEKKPITRTSWKDFDFKILPTNTRDCCYVITKDEKQQPARCWNPTADDLLADDWEVAPSEVKKEKTTTYTITVKMSGYKKRIKKNEKKK